MQLNFLLLKKDPGRVSDVNSIARAPNAKEFRIYIHSLRGYMNTFMLENGRPNIIIPGYDEKSNVNSTLDFHYYLIKYLT